MEKQKMEKVKKKIEKSADFSVFCRYEPGTIHGTGKRIGDAACKPQR